MNFVGSRTRHRHCITDQGPLDATFLPLWDWSIGKTNFFAKKVPFVLPRGSSDVAISDLTAPLSESKKEIGLTSE